MMQSSPVSTPCLRSLNAHAHGLARSVFHSSFSFLYEFDCAASVADFQAGLRYSNQDCESIGAVRSDNELGIYHCFLPARISVVQARPVVLQQYHGQDVGAIAKYHSSERILRQSPSTASFKRSTVVLLRWAPSCATSPTRRFHSWNSSQEQ